MKLLRYFVIVAAVGLATAASAGTASAWGWWGKDSCSSGNCGHGHAKPPAPTPATLFGGGLGHKPKLPVYQAAPWYNYWPYDGHFLTPAPISGPFYGPPMTGNFPVNPYFPGPSAPAGYGGYGYGGIPGGPPPAIPVAPAMPIPGAPGVPRSRLIRMEEGHLRAFTLASAARRVRMKSYAARSSSHSFPCIS